MGKHDIVYCCECDKNVETNIIYGSKVYPHREDLHKLKFKQCPTCLNFVGTHKNNGSALGVIANQEIKNYRKKIHAKLDPLWQSGIIKRTELYKIMTIQFDKHYHTASLRSINECEWAYHQSKQLALIAEHFKDDFHKALTTFGWYKRGNRKWPSN